jgi:hypothetical protein
MAERITITFETGSAAFENSPTEEIARILCRIADDLRDNGDTSEIIRDANGDAAGTIRIDSISGEVGVCRISATSGLGTPS